MWELATPLCQESKAIEGVSNNLQLSSGRSELLRMMLTMAYSFRACSFRCPGSYPTAWQGRYKSASAVTAASKEITRAGSSMQGILLPGHYGICIHAHADTDMYLSSMSAYVLEFRVQKWPESSTMPLVYFPCISQDSKGLPIPLDVQNCACLHVCSCGLRPSTFVAEQLDMPICMRSSWHGIATVP